MKVQLRRMMKQAARRRKNRDKVRQMERILRGKPTLLTQENR